MKVYVSVKSNDGRVLREMELKEQKPTKNYLRFKGGTFDKDVVGLGAEADRGVVVDVYVSKDTFRIE